MTGVEEVIIKTLVGSGPWALLFWYVWKQKDELVAKVMADSATREERITQEARAREEKLLKESREREDRLMACLGDLNLVKNDVEEVKTCIVEIKGDVKILKDRGSGGK